MKSDKKWNELATLARTSEPQAASTEMPFGFATRVVARWQASEPVSMATVWEWLSMRSLALAAVVMLVSLTINYDFLSGDWNQELAMTDAAIQDVLEP